MFAVVGLTVGIIAVLLSSLGLIMYGMQSAYQEQQTEAVQDSFTPPKDSISAFPSLDLYISLHTMQNICTWGCETVGRRMSAKAMQAM